MLDSYKGIEENITEFEMCNRWILNISWIQKRSNQQVLNKIGTKTELMKEKKLKPSGHILRTEAASQKRIKLCGRVGQERYGMKM